MVDKPDDKKGADIIHLFPELPEQLGRERLERILRGEYVKNPMITGPLDPETYEGAKRMMLEALAYGEIGQVRILKFQFGLDQNDMTTWDEYKEAVKTGINKAGNQMAGHETYDTDKKLGKVWEFYHFLGRRIFDLDLNECEGYKKILAATLLGALNTIEGADEAIKEAQKILDAFSEGIELESLIEAHKLMTPTQIALLKPQSDE